MVTLTLRGSHRAFHERESLSIEVNDEEGIFSRGRRARRRRCRCIARGPGAVGTCPGGRRSGGQAAGSQRAARTGQRQAGELPAESVRDGAQLRTAPNGRKWGSVSAVDVDPDGRSIWAADRCGTNSCAGSNVDPIIKFDSNGNILKMFGAGQILWPHGMDVDKQGNVWVVDARIPTADELKKFPRLGEQGEHGHQIQP
jgi:hypothetical protein